MIWNIISYDPNEDAAFCMRIQRIDNKVDDIENACREAAREYITTQEGLDVYLHSACEDFNWGDFFSNIPNSICAKHGFIILEDDTCDLLVDHNDRLIDEPAMKLRLKWPLDLDLSSPSGTEDRNKDLPSEMTIELAELLYEDEGLGDVSIDEYRARAGDYVKALTGKTPQHITFE